MKAFVSYVLEDEDAAVFTGLFESVAEEIHKINKEVVGNDFELATEV